MGRYSMFYSWTPISCGFCSRTWRGNGSREVPYHRDNSDRGVCRGSRLPAGGPAYERPRPLFGPPTPAMAGQAVRVLRRATRIVRKRKYPPSWLAYDVLLSTAESDRVHEVLGYASFSEFLDKEVTNAPRRRPWRWS